MAKLESFASKGLLFLFIIVAANGCAGLPFIADKNHIHSSFFSYEGPARSVCITGDFNQWAPDTHCLKQRNGVWVIILKLPAGTHRYAFIVNKEKWVVDPKALFVETDGYGRQNAVAVIN